MSRWKFLKRFKDFGKDEKAFTGLEAAIVHSDKNYTGYIINYYCKR